MRVGRRLACHGLLSASRLTERQAKWREASLVATRVRTNGPRWALGLAGRALREDGTAPAPRADARAHGATPSGGALPAEATWGAQSLSRAEISCALRTCGGPGRYLRERRHPKTRQYRRRPGDRGAGSDALQDPSARDGAPARVFCLLPGHRIPQKKGRHKGRHIDLEPFGSNLIRSSAVAFLRTARRIHVRSLRLTYCQA